MFDEMKALIAPELELIDSRIGGPAKELQSVLRLIRKSITKREHKVSFLDRLLCFIFDPTQVQLTDYDRFNNSLTKLRDKKDKSLNDEKNLFKVRLMNPLAYDCSRNFLAGTRFRDCYTRI